VRISLVEQREPLAERKDQRKSKPLKIESTLLNAVELLATPGPYLGYHNQDQIRQLREGVND
jgi:hypothetical protein